MMDPLLLPVYLFSPPPLTVSWLLLLLNIFVCLFLVLRGVTPFTNDGDNIPCIATLKSGDMALVPSYSSFLILLIPFSHWFLFVFNLLFFFLSACSSFLISVFPSFLFLGSLLLVSPSLVQCPPLVSFSVSCLLSTLRGWGGGRLCWVCGGVCSPDVCPYVPIDPTVPPPLPRGGNSAPSPPLFRFPAPFPCFCFPLFP